MKPDGNPMRVNRRRATSLIEVLVVMVVFLVGILAVIQIFPKGFRVLDLSRRVSVGQSLARELIQTIVAHPETSPEEIVPITQDINGAYIIDPTRSPFDLGPMAQTLKNDGNLYLAGGALLGDWQRFSGANTFRRVIGESQRIPAPRQAGVAAGYYGGVITLNYGPIDYRTAEANLSVYGNDLVQQIGVPSASATLDDTTYFVTNANGGGITLGLPSGETDRIYRVSFTAYVVSGGDVFKKEFIGVGPVSVLKTTPVLGQFPLTPVALSALTGGLALQSVDVSTIRVQRLFKAIPKGASFNDPATETMPDPYKYKILNEQLGVLLFSPDAYNVQVLRADGKREALVARINYDVYDWRILHEDFRISTETPVMHQFAVRGMKVGQETGPDGRSNGPIVGETKPLDATFTDTSATSVASDDNFVLMDLDTGGVYYETSFSQPGKKLIDINKSLAIATFTTLDPAQSGLIGELLLPDGTTRSIRMDGRAVRAMYRAKQEVSAQILKGASRYARLDRPTNLDTNNYFIGTGAATIAGYSGGDATRIYFSRSNQGRKVNIGEIRYYRAGDVVPRIVYSQDFTIDFARVDTSGFGLPLIDVKDIDPLAVALDTANTSAVRDVKGASVAVRVVWNPEMFALQPDPVANLNSLEAWGRNWRRSTNETYFVRSEVIR